MDTPQELTKAPEVKSAKKILMPFVAMKIDEALTQGSRALSLTVPFDELEVLRAFKDYFEKVRWISAVGVGADPCWSSLPSHFSLIFLSHRRLRHRWLSPTCHRPPRSLPRIAVLALPRLRLSLSRCPFTPFPFILKFTSQVLTNIEGKLLCCGLLPLSTPDW